MMLRTKGPYFVIAVVVVLVVLATTFFTDGRLKDALEILTVITAIVGAVALFIQFKKDKQINQASFMTEYSQQFYETFNCVEVFAVFDGALDNYEITDEHLDEKLRHDLVNYLIWCEGLASLVLQDILPIKQIDSLFSYRFFLVTNNKWVQNFELVPYHDSYVEIMKVHKIWTAYKRRHNLPIIGDENNLTDRMQRIHDGLETLEGEPIVKEEEVKEENKKA